MVLSPTLKPLANSSVVDDSFPVIEITPFSTYFTRYFPDSLQQENKTVINVSLKIMMFFSYSYYYWLLIN